MKALVLALIAPIALASCAARAESEACAVYRSFFAQLPAPQLQMLHSRSSLELLDQPRRTQEAPTRFQRGEGVMEPPELTPPEFIHENTAEYFDQLRNKPTMELADCFPNNSPRFVQPSKIDNVMDQMSAPDSDVLSVWELSPVAISRDGQRALMLGGMTCGGLCGGGAFYLFEKSGEGWVLIGHDDVWVS